MKTIQVSDKAAKIISDMIEAKEACTKEIISVLAHEMISHAQYELDENDQATMEALGCYAELVKEICYPTA
ncbi:MAG: hypothetical protein LUD17_09010 [Bacteroidales bacterium]|nr:hypothetical protein [Bacteroidales bacterium]